jgi:hypothetical protein
MQNQKTTNRDSSNKIRSQIMLLIFGTIASGLTVYHSLLEPDPLSVFYIILVSLLLTLLVIVINFSITKNPKNLQYLSKTSIFLCVYIFLIIWLGINKTIPEHQEIIEFQKKRSDFTYWLYKDEYDTVKELAILYMNASPAVERIEPNANHFGTKILRAYLEDQIALGKGSQHSQDMYDLAEATFTYSSRDLAHTWYQHAFEYGKKDALKRYEERNIHYK